MSDTSSSTPAPAATSERPPLPDHLATNPRSPHHVAAVLTKLDATSRQEAARRASELRLVETD